jgi:deoxyribodipyrimidine photolyase
MCWLQRVTTSRVTTFVLPQVVLQALWRECGDVEQLVFQSEPTTKDMEQDLCRIASEDGVKAVPTRGFSMHALETLVAKQRDKCAEPPGSFNRFLRLIENEKVPQVLPALEAVPPPPRFAERLERVPDCPLALRNPAGKGQSDDEMPDRLLPGGEAAALVRLASLCENVAYVATFSKPDTNPLRVVTPATPHEASTTLLSPYLAYGCLSPREVYAQIAHALSQYHGRTTKPPQSLIAQLLWRDHFHLEAFMAGPGYMTASHGRCLAVAWHPDPQERLSAWEEGLTPPLDFKPNPTSPLGRTNVPLVDAAMRQLVTTGWMHHILRHVVACFLTRGALWVSWEHGMRVFARHLLDHDPAVNCGNWQWLAGCNYFYTYNRVYNFETFAKKHDPAGHFARAWLPELRDGRKKGSPYALPPGGMDLATAREENLARMDEAYANGPEAFLQSVPPHAREEICRERGLKIPLWVASSGKHKQSLNRAVPHRRVQACTTPLESSFLPPLGEAQAAKHPLERGESKLNNITEDAVPKTATSRKKGRRNRSRVQGTWAESGA